MSRTLIVATMSYAGMGPYVSEIVNAFALDDELFYFFVEYEDCFYQKNIRLELKTKSRFFNIKNSMWNKIRELLPINPVYKKSLLSFCKKKEIGKVHFINNPAPVLLQKELKKMNIDVVCTIHDLHPHEARKEWYKELRFKILYAQLKKNFLYGDIYITNCKSQYNEIRRDYPAKKVYYHSFPSLVSESIRNGNKIPEELKCLNRSFILFFGRIEEYKGISLLYDVFCDCPEFNKNYYLVIAGSGTLPFDRRDDENNVIMVNRYIDDAEVSFLYKQARCVVYPYTSATQSGVLSLAYYYGTPTLVSDVPFFKDAVDCMNVGCIFKAGDKESLKKQMMSLLQVDREVIAEKEKVAYELTFDKVAIRNQLLKIYEDLND